MRETASMLLSPSPIDSFVFSMQERKLSLTNALEKKMDKLSPVEKKKALINQKDYQTRVKDGVYYG